MSEKKNENSHLTATSVIKLIINANKTVHATKLTARVVTTLVSLYCKLEKNSKIISKNNTFRVRRLE